MSINFDDISFPIAICNGQCGLGKSDSIDLNNPAFLALSFDGLSRAYYQPKVIVELSAPIDNARTPDVISCADHPSEGTFINGIETFKHDPSLTKVVLAKKRHFNLSSSFTIKQILKLLLDNFPKERIFLYSEDGTEIFFGATPENLYIREKQRITVDSLAGTATLDDKSTLFTPKFIEEHQIVTDYVESQLSRLCSHTETSELTTKQAAHLLHLHREISGELNKNLSDFDIISALHPTPATLGYPKEKSFDFLQKHETFRRGLYAGTLGWISNDSAILKVALRCAKAEPKSLTLYAGAGITKDSIALDEYTEINQKFKTLEEVFFETVMSN